MAKVKLTVVIVGAGLGGLAAAIGIARAGHQVIVIEQAAILSEIGAGIQIPPNSNCILKEWGLDQKISDASVSVPEISLRSYRDGKILSSLALDPYMVDTYGFPNLYIHRADYHRILVEEAQRLGVRLQLGSKVTGVDSQKPAVQIQDQADVSADIVIGADGINSGCREALLGHPDPPRETGDLAYRVVIKRQDMRTHPLLSDISESSPTNYWLGPDSHAICYPLRGGDLYNLVIIRPDNLPDFVNVASANIQELQEYFTGWEPRFRAVLEMVEDATKWRMLSSEELKVWSSPSKKFVLLGDACHATLPYLAQGAAQAVEDGAVLGRLFEKISHHEQLRDIVTIYEAIRKPRASAIVKGSTACQAVYHMHDGPLQEERDRQLLEEEPFEGYPNRWKDPTFQRYLYAYNAFDEADKAWMKYISGIFPMTEGAWRYHKGL